MEILAWTIAPTNHQYQASPSLCNQWAQSDGAAAAAARGEENVNLLGEMAEKFFDENSKMPKAALMNLTAACAGGLGQFATAIHNQNVAGPNPTFAGFGATAPSDYQKSRFRRATKAMCGFAANMAEWAYPACRHYYTAQNYEAGEYFSRDFTTKHLASTDDEKSSLRAAKIRATPVPMRDVFAYGNILTSHSGAIRRGESQDMFRNEVKARQQEFTDTHRLLCKYFVENFLILVDPPQGRFLMIDGVTFVSHAPLDMFEFETPSPTATPIRKEGTYHVHFSISATEDGTAWAVHHLARAEENPQHVPPQNTLLTDVIGNTHGYTALDPATYMHDLPLG